MVCDSRYGRERVVLFTSEGEGTVVNKGDGIFEVGYNSSSWDLSYYTSYNGSVCLEND